MTPADPHAAIAARTLADRALRDDAPLDYDRPFKPKPWDRSATAKLFASACELGDKHACIVAAELVPLDTAGDSFRIVAAHCMAGDEMSCRALPPDADTQRFPDAPGAMSRRAECQKYGLPAPCSVDTLRTECNAGFPAACSEIGASKTQPPDGEDLFARYPGLSLGGCHRGIASECAEAAQYGSTADQLDTAQRLCDLRRDGCGALASVYHDANDATNEREALERACEYGKDRWNDCVVLGTGYVDSRFPEPVPGRGQALLDWACPKLAVHVGEEGLKRFPGCLHATR